MGAPNSAMTPSPRNWLTVPSYRCTSARISSKTRVIKPWTFSGSRRSLSDVNPETSANITVTSLRSPSSAPRAENLLGEVLGGIALGLREAGSRSGRPRLPELLATAVAEATGRRIGLVARGTGQDQRRAATVAERRIRRIVLLALRTRHSARIVPKETADKEGLTKNSRGPVP